MKYTYSILSASLSSDHRKIQMLYYSDAVEINEKTHIFVIRLQNQSKQNYKQSPDSKLWVPKTNSHLASCLQELILSTLEMSYLKGYVLAQFIAEVFSTFYCFFPLVTGGKRINLVIIKYK